MNSRITTPWTKGEVEHLVDMMEDNSEELQGKQAAWYHKVLDEDFYLYINIHIDVKRICDKALNMKK